MSAWQIVPLRKAPQIVCCYVVLGPQGPLYIGSTIHLRTRLSGHLRKPWIRKMRAIKVRQCPSEDAARELERRMIWRLRPEFNKIGKRPLSLYELWPEMEEFDRQSAEEEDRKLQEYAEFERLWNEQEAAEESRRIEEWNKFAEEEALKMVGAKEGK